MTVTHPVQAPRTAPLSARPAAGPNPSSTSAADPAGSIGSIGLVAAIAPNWFAAVMGTGIIATAAVSLPFGLADDSGLRTFALGAWALASTLLVVFSVATAGQWIGLRAKARSHHRNPVTAHFYGAPPMAMLTVGAGTLLVGKDAIGPDAALTIAWTLWVLGTATGLITAFAVPYWHFTGALGAGSRSTDAAFGGWLMSVVPPMVSATTGAQLLPHVPAGQPRLTLLLSLYAMFGVTLIAALILITQLWTRLVQHGLPPAKLVPTLWIVLGPLGQSATAACAIGQRSGTAIDDPYATALRVFGLVYGVPVLGFALLWAGLALALTLRTARSAEGLPFAPTWWAFTFPVGTCVTAAAGLSTLSGADVLGWLAVTLFTGLLTGWLIAASGSLTALRRSRTAAQRPVWAYSI